MEGQAFVIRRAGVADADVIARHRADMFRDMGQLSDEWRPVLMAHTANVLRTDLESGEYVGWLASPAADPATIVGGGGALLRRRLARIAGSGAYATLAPGLEALIVNVYTEPEWRRRGVARRIVEEIVAWARANGRDTIVLHASQDGRGLYESIGFRATNEMRYVGPPRT